MTNLLKLLRGFRADESGAITVDWVALTAGIVFVTVAVVYAIFRDGVDPLADAIGSEQSNQSSQLSAFVSSAPTFTD